MTESGSKSITGQKIEARVKLWISGLIAFGSFLTLVFEMIRGTYEWLRFGESQKAFLSSLVQIPQVEWVGVQNVFNFVWGLPLMIVAFATMFISVWYWSLCSEHLTELNQVRTNGAEPEA